MVNDKFTTPDFLNQKVKETSFEENPSESIEKKANLSVAEARKIGEKVLKQDAKERAVEEIGFYAGEIWDLEVQFRKQLERTEERGELQIKKEEFVRWETDYRDMWKKVQRQVGRGNLSSDEEARAEAKMFLYSEGEDLATTVEAQAGLFFVERERALLRKIRENGGNEEDLAITRGFAKAVDEHLDFKYMSREEISEYGYKNYDDNRTVAHNKAIKQLNEMNELAEKYGTERFTPRDFWTSEMPKSEQTPAIQKRMK